MNIWDVPDISEFYPENDDEGIRESPAVDESDDASWEELAEREDEQDEEDEWD